MRVTPRLAPFALLAACASARDRALARPARAAAQSASRVAPARRRWSRARPRGGAADPRRGRAARGAGGARVHLAPGVGDHRGRRPRERLPRARGAGLTGLRDLDAHLFDPRATSLVEDVETDPHPTVQICHHGRAPRLPRARRLRGATARSRGGLRRRPRGPRRGGARDGRPGPRWPSAPAASAGDRAPDERAPRRHRAPRLPARRGPTRSDFAAGGARRARPPDPDRCYTFAAVADGEVRDADPSCLTLRVTRSHATFVTRATPQCNSARPLPPRSRWRCGARSGARRRRAPGVSADAASLGGANAMVAGRAVRDGGARSPRADDARGIRLAAAGG